VLTAGKKVNNLNISVARWLFCKPFFTKVACFETKWLEDFYNGFIQKFGLNLACFERQRHIPKIFGFLAYFWLVLKKSMDTNCSFCSL